MGFGAGIALPTAQIYVAECSDPETRGVIGSFPALAMSLGVLVTYIMGTYLVWNVLAWTCGCIACKFCCSNIVQILYIYHKFLFSTLIFRCYFYA